MRREWQPEELIASWTLIDRDWELLSNKSGATRLGFALLLRFFDLEARFPGPSGKAAAGGRRLPMGSAADRHEKQLYIPSTDS